MCLTDCLRFRFAIRKTHFTLICFCFSISLFSFSFSKYLSQYKRVNVRNVLYSRICSHTSPRRPPHVVFHFFLIYIFLHHDNAYMRLYIDWNICSSTATTTTLPSAAFNLYTLYSIGEKFRHPFSVRATPNFSSRIFPFEYNLKGFLLRFGVCSLMCEWARTEPMTERWIRFLGLWRWTYAHHHLYGHVLNAKPSDCDLQQQFSGK